MQASLNQRQLDGHDRRTQLLWPLFARYREYVCRPSALGEQITVLRWHPTAPAELAVGTKYGSLRVFRLSLQNPEEDFGSTFARRGRLRSCRKPPLPAEAGETCVADWPGRSFE